MRLEQLTFTRFLAAIAIVIFHYGRNVFPFDHSSVDYLFQQASIGVSYFFILSGFVMVIAYAKNDKIEFREFMKKRFARIYPAYVLAIVLLFLYYVAAKKHLNYKEIFLGLALIQSWFPGYAATFNFPSWSLSVEIFFYLIFPFLFNYLYKKIALKNLIAPIFIFFIISQAAVHIMRYSSFYDGYPSKSHDFIFYFPLMHLNQFLIGNLAGLFFLRGIKSRNYDLPIIGLTLLVVLLLKMNTWIIYDNGLIGFIFVPLILFISANTGRLTRLSEHKALIFLGEISYGIYILQKPVCSWVNGAFKYFNIGNDIFIFYSSIIALILFSAISYKYLESPLRKIITRRL